jgi:hypothetical protein
VGDRDVRLVTVVADVASGGTLWLCEYWTKDGYPDPEALVLGSRNEAREWVLEPPPGAEPVGSIDKPWFVAATYRFGDEEAYAVASLAKCIIG